MLRLDGLTYRVGARVLLDRAEATVDAGHRVGLVGRNGSGKTTLLRLIAGALEPDEGGIHVPKRWRVGMTSQESPGGPRSLIETVLGADDELVRLTAEADTAASPEAAPGDPTTDCGSGTVRRTARYGGRCPGT